MAPKSLQAGIIVNVPPTCFTHLLGVMALVATSAELSRFNQYLGKEHPLQKSVMERDFEIGVGIAVGNF